jgi:hypothetical protein
VIDGILHAFGKATAFLGTSIREYIDKLIINELIGDGTARLTQWFGGRLQPLQTGRIQQYMLASLGLLIIVGGCYSPCWCGRVKGDHDGFHQQLSFEPDTLLPTLVALVIFFLPGAR